MDTTPRLATCSRRIGLGCALLLAALAADAATPAAPALDWGPCAEDPAYECAVARLPLDYDEPAGPRTRVALARVRARDGARRIGTLFLNPGGPGGSGVDLILGGYGDYMAGRLRGRFDIVGFDPRGVGRSEPLHCFRSEAALFAWWNRLPYYPIAPAVERGFFEDYGSLAPRCFARDERIIGHMSTADVARDLDLLRQAVGDEALTYVGWSYGSYIGNTYANLFPRHVRALVIDGVLDPVLWAGGRHIELDRTATAAEFEEFLRLCDEAACALGGTGGAARRFRRLERALRNQPLLFPDGTVYSVDYLIADAVGAMYAPEEWPAYAEYFAALREAVQGAGGASARAQSLREALDRGRTAARAHYANDFDAYYGNQCADTQYPSTFERFRSLARYAAAGSEFGTYWWWQNVPCAAWPAAPDRYAGPWTARTSAPVLVVGNYFDGITDYAGAVASSALLPNSRLLSYAGWGHTAYGRSACVTRHVDVYLLRGALPATGTVCPANPNPFAAPALRAAPGETGFEARPVPLTPGVRR